jgi:hypothetical protein
MINSTLIIFYFLLFFFSICVVVLTLNTQKKLSLKCTDSNVQNGLNFILMVSVSLMILPLLRVFCHWKCECPQNDIPYKVIMIIICILMIIASSTIINGINKNKKTCDTESTKTFAIVLLTVSILLFSFLIFTFSNKWKNFIYGEK